MLGKPPSGMKNMAPASLSRRACVVGALTPYNHGLPLAGLRARGAGARYASIAINLRARQQGVTLMIALIVLVVMTLAGIALVRSVDTSNIIAGNLAFQQAATNSGDSGIEAAISWLEAHNSGDTLHNDKNTDIFYDTTSATCQGYSASSADLAGVSWDTWWHDLNSLLTPCKTIKLTTDAAGNTVSYTIERMCQKFGAPSNVGTNCSVSSITTDGGSTSSQTSGYIALQYSGQIYYRITSRIDGPRGTKSYVQAIVAM